VTATNNSNGQALTFEGDAVVCTASVGVLRANLIQFSPQLPDWKVQALNEIEMGNYVKIYCVFPRKFWDNSEYIFIANERKGTYPMWMPMGNTNEGPMMMTVVAGPEANRVEMQTDDQIINEIHYHLSTVYKGKGVAEHDMKPVKVHVCKWMKDPRYFGAYSFLKTGAFNENPTQWHWLGAPCSTMVGGMSARPTLYFAGEAYDFRYGG
jgi:polyamine oxidase